MKNFKKIFKNDKPVIAEYFQRVFDIDLPDEEASTIAGLVMYESRSIPSPGQEFRFHNLRIRILNKEQNNEPRKVFLYLTMVKVTLVFAA